MKQTIIILLFTLTASYSYGNNDLNTREAVKSEVARVYKNKNTRVLKVLTFKIKSKKLWT